MVAHLRMLVLYMCCRKLLFAVVVDVGFGLLKVSDDCDLPCWTTKNVPVKFLQKHGSLQKF